jgi:hypothetical protein
MAVDLCSAWDGSRSSLLEMPVPASLQVPESSRPVRKVAKRPHQTSTKDVTAGERILLPALNQHAIPAGAETSQIAQ